MMTLMRKYFGGQVREIGEDPALRVYGMFIALCQVLTFFQWINRGQFYDLSNAAVPVCWPFFENCGDFRVLDAAQVNAVLVMYGACALAGVVLFAPPLARKFLSLAYGWLILTNIFKMLILFQDYRLRMNQHYMLFFMTAVFVFLPNKRNLLRYTLVLFYLWAGALKLNPEWLSGSALYRDPLWIHGAAAKSAACAYVVFLELVVVWGLLSRDKWLYRLSFAQIMIFHIESWPVVGFFYPTLMFALLSIFPLARGTGKEREPAGLAASLWAFQQPPGTYVFIAVFSFLQLVPRFFPGNPALTGEGRIFALSMFDARTVCSGQMTLRFRGRPPQKVPIPGTEDIRVHCDPAVTYSRARWLCLRHKNDPSFVDLDIRYRSQLSTGASPLMTVDIPDFCGSNTRYELLRHNDWIKTTNSL